MDPAAVKGGQDRVGDDGLLEEVGGLVDLALLALAFLLGAAAAACGLTIAVRRIR